MPNIFINTIPGYPIEQKKGLVRDITEAVVKNLGVKPEHVNITIVEHSKENLAKGGKLFKDLGM